MLRPYLSLDKNNIKHVLIATGTPRDNGQVEIINRTIKPMLAKLAPATDQWDEVVDKVEYSVNNTVNRSTGVTPSTLLFGINQREYVDDNLRIYTEKI